MSRCTIEPHKLPHRLRRFLLAHAAGHPDVALRFFAPAAVVVDRGRTFRGTDAVATFLAAAAAEPRRATELIGAEQIDDAHWTATNRLLGDVPGGTADLEYRFAMTGDLIAELVIEP